MIFLPVEVVGICHEPPCPGHFSHPGVVLTLASVQGLVLSRGQVAMSLAVVAPLNDTGAQLKPCTLSPCSSAAATSAARSLLMCRHRVATKRKRVRAPGDSEDDSQDEDSEDEVQWRELLRALVLLLVPVVVVVAAVGVELSSG